MVHDPDRLAWRYAYQVLLLEELQRWCVQVRFIEQSAVGSPHQKLQVQIQKQLNRLKKQPLFVKTKF